MKVNYKLLIFTLLEFLTVIYFSSILYKDWSIQPVVKDCFAFIIIGEIGIELYVRYTSFLKK